MNKLYELQRHVLPKTSFSDFSELFVNITDTIISNNRLVKTKAYKFDTWMNMFAGKKHYKYCDLGELYLPKQRFQLSIENYICKSETTVIFTIS